MSEKKRTPNKKRLLAAAMVALAAIAVVSLPAPDGGAMPVNSCITTYLNSTYTEVVGYRHVTCMGQIFRDGTPTPHTIVDCEECGGGGCHNTCWANIGGVPFYSCCTFP